MGLFSWIGKGISKLATGAWKAITTVVKGIGTVVGKALDATANMLDNLFAKKGHDKLLESIANIYSVSRGVNTGNQLIDSLFTDNQFDVPSYFNVEKNKQFLQMYDKNYKLYTELITYSMSEQFDLYPYSRTYTKNNDEFNKDYSYNSFGLPEDVFYVQGKSIVKQAQQGNFTSMLNHLITFFKIDKSFLSIDEPDEYKVILIGAQINLFRTYSGNNFPFKQDYSQFPTKFLYNVYPQYQLKKDKSTSTNRGGQSNISFKIKYDDGQLHTKQKELLPKQQTVITKFTTSISDKVIDGKSGLVHLNIKDKSRSLLRSISEVKKNATK